MNKSGLLWKEEKMEYISLAHLIVKRAQDHKEILARMVYKDESWQSFYWKDHFQDIINLAAAFRKRGIERQQCVGIVGHTCREWELLDLANVINGSISVGIYPTSTAEQMEFICKDANIKINFVQNSEPFANSPNTTYLFSQIDDWIREGQTYIKETPNFVDDILKEHTADAIFTLVYTSGTTGRPKGVILTHCNMVVALENIEGLIGGNPEERTLGYLPLAHILQRIGIYRSLYTGTCIVYVPSLEQLMPTMAATSPTQLSAVPRILEKIYEKFAGHLQPGWENSPLRNTIAKQAQGLLGGKLKSIYVGGAPLSTEVCRFFHHIGIPVYEGYGLTEVSCVITINTEENCKIGSVGKALPGVDIKIGTDGEVMVKSLVNFQGYHNLPKETANVFTEDWFHTGDIGHLDENGYLYITGRKKDLIITAGGKNIAPAPIEFALGNHPLISQVIVHGDRRKYLTALVTISAEYAVPFLKEHGVEDFIPDHKQIYKTVEEHIDQVNTKLASFEQIKCFAILSREFSADLGEVTPTLKLKRPKIEENFAEVLEDLYSK